MNASPPPGEVPQPRRHRTPWPGLVWSIPLAAFIIVAYLGIRAFTQRGEIVTVTFKRAADARPNDTKVLYQGVEAGHLVKITPNKDGRRLDFRLRLLPEAKAGLNTNARFWLIGANPNLADLSSLKAVVSGVAIGYAPGEGGTPTDQFDGLDRAPIVLPGDHGTRYRLTARTLGSLSEGSAVLFHGQLIGKLTDVQFDGVSGFNLQIFIFRPYDSLITPGTRFWRMSPLRLSLANGGVNATLAPASTLLSGGIDLAVPPRLAESTPSPPDAQFTLYGNRAAADQGLSGPTARYEFAFEGATGTLDEFAAVTLLGFQIGEVETARLAYDKHSGKPFTKVTAVIYPKQLEVTATAADPAEWQVATDAKVRELLHLGYRARLQQSPALVGDESIALVEIRGAGSAELGRSGSDPVIPSAPGGSSIADITTKADQILDKVNAIPIAEIGRNLQQATSRLSTLVSSPQLSESLTHVGHTLAEADAMLAEVQPKIGPLLTKLNEAADQISATAAAAHQLLAGEGADGGTAEANGLPEAIRQLSEAARSIRSLTDYLGRHPEALLRGKRSN